MGRKIRWGILGCGTIAHLFAEDLIYSRYGMLAAVGSRTQGKAMKFAKAFSAERSYGSYKELVRDPEVDIIYVSTPHPFHMEHSLLAIQAGKSVLCEKPFAMNACQVRRMREAASKRQLFLMEGMWTRFFPAIRQLQKWLEEERIGKVCSFHAEFGARFEVGPGHRILDPLLGGGALLDLGIYVVSLASLVFGQQPETIETLFHKAQTGVDDQGALLFGYPDGAIASLSFSSRVPMDQRACIQGTLGKIVLTPNFYRPSRVLLQLERGKEQPKEYPHPGTGFQYEADHAAVCLKSGKIQSDTMPLQESLEIMQTMDRIRRKWVLKYPNE